MGYKKKKAAAKKAKNPKQTASNQGATRQEPGKQTPTVVPEFEKKACEYKDVGNHHFGRKEYREALDAYNRGIDCFKSQKSLKSDQMSTKHALLSNRAFIKLKLDQFDDAEHDCTVVLDEDSRNVKAFYRRALAREGMARQIFVQEQQIRDKTEGDSALSPVSAVTNTTDITESASKKILAKEAEKETSDPPTTQQPEQPETETDQKAMCEKANSLILSAQMDIEKCRKVLAEGEGDNGNMKKSIDQLSARLQKSVVEFRRKGKAPSKQHHTNEQLSTVMLLLSNRQSCMSGSVALDGEAFFLLEWEWWCSWCQYVGLVGGKRSNVTRFLLPGACLPESRNDDEEESDDDDDDDLPLPPGQIDNSRLILSLPSKITPETASRDVFHLDWYEEYTLDPVTADNGNDKENVNSGGAAAARPTSNPATNPAVLPNLVRGYHYELIPREVYAALRSWYGEVTLPICRRVGKSDSRSLTLTIYPGLDESKSETTSTSKDPCWACFAPRASSKCIKCLTSRYCNRSCQESHWPCHKSECKALSTKPSSGTSRRGTSTVGLNNLGNTCFMNSALQSLSHVVPLTRHFLSGIYKLDLNADNPLGTGGKLANAYAAVMRDLWWSKKSSVSPTSLKRAIALFAPRFAGCIQHDTQEFLAYLLDGLHEDINRIRKAPYLEMPDVTDGQNMSVAGAQAWEAHCRRNDSLVMDTFYGQFKSTCVCPQCSRVSVSFDAFNHVSLEIPHAKNALVYIPVVLVAPGSTDWKEPTQFAVEIRRNNTISDLRMCLTRLSGIEAERLNICMVSESNIVLRPESTASISDIRSDHVVCAYVDPVEVHPALLCVVNHRVLLEESTDQPYGDDLIGLPFMFSAAPDVTCKQLFEELCQRTAFIVGEDYFEQSDLKSRLQVRFHNGRGVSQPFFPPSEGNDIEEEQLSEEEETRSPYLTPDSDKKLVEYVGQETVGKYTFISLEWVEEEDGDIDVGQFARISKHQSWFEYTQRQKSPKPSVSLDQCFSAFTKPERLDENNMWYCSKCKEHVRAVKTMELWRLPNVLIVHLKRFEFNNILRRDKLDMLVDFPLSELDMSRHCASHGVSESIVSEEVPAVYDLFAVTNHYGRMGAGHYTAFARSWNDQGGVDSNWSLFDDSKVRPVPNMNPADAIVSPAAYVLFYRRRVFH